MFVTLVHDVTSKITLKHDDSFQTLNLKLQLCWGDIYKYWMVTSHF